MAVTVDITKIKEDYAKVAADYLVICEKKKDYFRLIDKSDFLDDVTKDALKLKVLYRLRDLNQQILKQAEYIKKLEEVI